MAPPLAISLSTVVAALTTTAQSAPAIAKSLGLSSRATLHRKLTQLIEQGLVINSGNGRNSAYRLPLPEEELLRARANMPSLAGQALRMDMSLSLAGVMSKSLENTCRLGIGQIEQMEDALPWSSTLEQIEQAKHHIKDLKTLFGFSLGASHGIHSPHVARQNKICWEVHRAIRHRLAWDRTPAGSMGVDFNEPLSDKEFFQNLIVLSSQDESGQARITIEMDADTARIVVYALTLQSRLDRGDFAAVVDMAYQGLIRNAQGALVDGAMKSTAYTMAKRITDALGANAFASGIDTEKSAISAGIADAIECVLTNHAPQAMFGKDLNQISVLKVNSEVPPMKVTLKMLPAGYFIRFNQQSRQFNVIGPCQDPNYLEIVSESHSPQTAILIALNKFENRPGRAW